MRTVIYDAETHEPLTVIDVPERLFRRILDGGPRILHFPVHPPMSTMDVVLPTSVPKVSRPPNVTISFEPIRRGGEILFWMATAEDATTALLLKSTFLPGQWREVQRRQTAAFLRGLAAAIGT